MGIASTFCIKLGRKWVLYGIGYELNNWSGEEESVVTDEYKSYFKEIEHDEERGVGLSLQKG